QYWIAVVVGEDRLVDHQVQLVVLRAPETSHRLTGPARAVDAAQRIGGRQAAVRSRGQLGENRAASIGAQSPLEAVVASSVAAGVARVGAEAAGEPGPRADGGEDAGRGERVDGCIDVQTLRREVAEGGVQEDTSTLRDHEVGVGGDLTDLQDEAIVVEGL